MQLITNDAAPKALTAQARKNLLADVLEEEAKHLKPTDIFGDSNFLAQYPHVIAYLRRGTIPLRHDSRWYLYLCAVQSIDELYNDYEIPTHA